MHATARRRRHRKPGPKRVLERIPIAGLYNLLYANSKREKKIWAIILLIAFAITLRYLIPTIIQFTKFETVVDLQQAFGKRAPFPSLYVCAAGSLNRTYFSTYMNTALKELETDDFIRKICIRFSVSYETLMKVVLIYATYLPHIDPNFFEILVPAYNEILNKMIKTFGSRWHGYKDFYANGAYSCDMLLSNCKFNGEQFPCCSSDPTDSVSTLPSSCTRLNIPEHDQSQTTKRSQLEFESSFDTRYVFEHFDELASLYLHIGSHQLTLFDPTYLIPAGTVSFVDVKAKQRQMLDGCVDRFHFNEATHSDTHLIIKNYFKNMENEGQYNVNKCWMATLFEEIATHCGCVISYDTMQPDDNSICTPAHMYSCVHLGFRETDNHVPARNASQVHETKTKFTKAPKTDLLAALLDRVKECLPSCKSWQYKAYVTALPLLGNRTSIIIQNRVIVTLDEEYWQEADVLKIDLISFFAAIGDSLGLFLGVSVVCIVQGIVWSWAALILKRNQRRVAPLRA